MPNNENHDNNQNSGNDDNNENGRPWDENVNYDSFDDYFSGRYHLTPMPAKVPSPPSEQK